MCPIACSVSTRTDKLPQGVTLRHCEGRTNDKSPGDICRPSRWRQIRQSTPVFFARVDIMRFFRDKRTAMGDTVYLEKDAVAATLMLVYYVVLSSIEPSLKFDGNVLCGFVNVSGLVL